MHVLRTYFLLLVGSACLRVGAGDHGEIVRYSPFLPEGYRQDHAVKPAATPALRPVDEPMGIVCRGLVQMGDGLTLVSLHDSRSGLRQWAGVGDDVFGVRVSHIVPESGRVEVQRGGLTYQIAMPNAEDFEAKTLMQPQVTETVVDNAQRPLIPFNSLPPEVQENFFHPRYIGDLERAGVEVPDALRRLAGPAGNTRSRNLSDSVADEAVQPVRHGSSLLAEGSMNAGQVMRYDPTPRVSNALTFAEKAMRAKANGYSN